MHDGSPDPDTFPTDDPDSTSMVSAPTPSRPPRPRKRMPKAATVPTLDDGQLWLLRYTYITDPNATIPELAKSYGITEYRVSKALSGPEFEHMKTEVQRDSVARAKDRLLSLTDLAVSAWQTSLPVAGKKGDHRPARDLLMANRVVEPKGTGPTVNITIGVQADKVAVQILSPGVPTPDPTQPGTPALPPGALPGEGGTEGGEG